MPVVPAPQIYTNGSIRVSPTQQVAHLQADVQKQFLQLLADTGRIHIVEILQSGIFKHPTGALANSIQGAVQGDAVVWWSDVRYASAQERGVRPHQMWYLLNKTVPITVYERGNEYKIYRRATLKSLLAGKWFHPGYPGKWFMKRGIEMTLAEIPQLLNRAQEIVFHLQGGKP